MKEKIRVDRDVEPIKAYTPAAFDGSVMLLNTQVGRLTGRLTKRDDQAVMNRQTDRRAGRFSVRVSSRELARIEERAKVAGLSIAAYLRAAGLSHPVRSVLDYDAVRELAKVNADQSRLGNLLKLGVEDRSARVGPEIDVRRLLERIDALQKQLIDVVSRV